MRMTTEEKKNRELLRKIEDAIKVHRQADEVKKEDIIAVFEAIREAIHAKGSFLVPIEIEGEGDEAGISFREIKLYSGDHALVAFTSDAEVKEGQETATICLTIERFFEYTIQSASISGIVINPWKTEFFLPKEYIHKIFEANLPQEKENEVSFCLFDEIEDDDNIVVPMDKDISGGVRYRIGTKEQCTCHPALSISAEQEKTEREIKYFYWDFLEQVRLQDKTKIVLPIISHALIDEKTLLPIIIETIFDWNIINPHCSMQIMLACSAREVQEQGRTLWQEYAERYQEEGSTILSNQAVEDAIVYAVACHRGSVRKGKDTPYIFHPLETMQILASMKADNNLLIAGLLHDTLEDTDAILRDIWERFGRDIARLVNVHTEDKRPIWYMRKLHSIKKLTKEELRVKMLVLADKTANLRSMYRDYKMVGEELWSRFRAPKELQAWYYSGIQDGLYELQKYLSTEEIYWEMVALFKDLFVNYYLDDKEQCLYQACADGTVMRLKNGTIRWTLYEDASIEQKREITRKEAEQIEDEWAEPFWKAHENDMADAVYELPVGRNILQIEDAKLYFFAEDKMIYQMKEEDTHRLLVQLRMQDTTERKLSDILCDRFGQTDGVARFRSFCDDIGVDIETKKEAAQGR